MGPLVPEIFNPEFNFVIALALGFFFGYVLEQAGFSSSKKLAGLFYGYDFVVLRVFFTAGITAMIGVSIFGYLGWLDLSLIYINPTFLWSAIVGGLIMGAGFIIGGFCPGTSVAAAAIGKIDAMVFLVGAFLGVLIFGELYPVFEPIYTGWDFGAWRLDEAIGFSRGLFVFAMVIMALVAFFFTARIENRVNKITVPAGIPFFKQEHNRFLPYAAVFVFAGFILIFLPSRENRIIKALEKEIAQNPANVQTIEPLELAFRIIDEDTKITVVDLRKVIDSSKTTIPGAINIPFETILQKQGKEFIKKEHKTIVFVDEDGSLAMKAAIFARDLNNHRAMALTGGINLFDKTFNTDAQSLDLDTLVEYEFKMSDIHSLAEYEFKATVLEKFKVLHAKHAAKNKPPTTEARKSAGGC